MDVFQELLETARAREKLMQGPTNHRLTQEYWATLRYTTETVHANFVGIVPVCRGRALVIGSHLLLRSRPLL